ncbi:hypothetical protein B0H14DRAFT_3153442 [Mycena olivaceomarginata]|nr:hypothetical protein B0H14DRAFT_3153442 [Mycena olivaceomarginata]
MAPTDYECGMFQDHQLLLNTMAGLINAPWTFNCSGVDTDSDTQQFGPTFKDCADDRFHSLPNLCIGGIKDQHACSVGTCNVIDWNGAVAARQAPGMATPCCNSDDCTIPSGKYTCDASRTLQLCVVDATAAQCVEPISNTICSGNFSAVVAPPSGSTGNTVSHAFPTNEPNTVTHGFPGTTVTDGFAASQTPQNGPNNTAASSGGSSGLSHSDVIAIAAIFASLLAAGLARRDQEKGAEGKSVFVGGVTSGGTGNSVINNISYFIGMSDKSRL